MGTKPEDTKPKLWSNHEAEAEAEVLTVRKHEAEAEAEAELLAFSKYKAEAEAQVLLSYYKYPLLPLITCHLLKFRQNIQANMIWKWKMLRIPSFETTKPNLKFWICEVMKPKPKPKLFPSHEAEAEAETEALSFWNHVVEAKARSFGLKCSFVPMSDLFFS